MPVESHTTPRPCSARSTARHPYLEGEGLTRRRAGALSVAAIRGRATGHLAAVPVARGRPGADVHTHGARGEQDERRHAVPWKALERAYLPVRGTAVRFR